MAKRHEHPLFICHACSKQLEVIHRSWCPVCQVWICHDCCDEGLCPYCGEETE